MSDALLERLRAELPVECTVGGLAGRTAGLVIANASATPCAADGSALVEADLPPRTAAALAESARLARGFLARRWPVLAFLDGRNAAPLAPALAWLRNDPDVALLGKDCASGFVGAMEAVHHGQHGTFHNRALDWINAHRLQAVLVAGLSTDVCVMELVLGLLAARAHAMLPTLHEVVVVEPATATYDRPGHPADPMHHIALHLMAARGAVIASAVEGL